MLLDFRYSLPSNVLIWSGNNGRRPIVFLCLCVSAVKRFRFYPCAAPTIELTRTLRLSGISACASTRNCGSARRNNRDSG